VGGIARQNVGRRVAVAVAIADLDDRDERSHSGEEGVGRGCAAAVVGHEQDVAAQRRRVVGDERRLLRRLDVAREEHAAARGIGDAQDAAAGVGLRARRRGLGQRVQHVEAHAVPAPGLARGATHLGQRNPPQRMAVVERAAQREHG
jgi:hypothetical protein